MDISNETLQPGTGAHELPINNHGANSTTAQCLKRFYVDLHCHRLISQEYLVNLFEAHPEWRLA